jgi:hypothetical protein
MFFFLPDTKDRTLEEIDEMFEKRLPAWKFKSYVCVAANESRMAGLRGKIIEVGDKETAQHIEDSS